MVVIRAVLTVVGTLAVILGAGIGWAEAGVQAVANGLARIVENRA